jgi:hypothetical protein
LFALAERLAGRKKNPGAVPSLGTVFKMAFRYTNRNSDLRAGRFLQGAHPCDTAMNCLTSIGTHSRRSCHTRGITVAAVGP